MNISAGGTSPLFSPVLPHCVFPPDPFIHFHALDPDLLEVWGELSVDSLRSFRGWALRNKLAFCAFVCPGSKGSDGMWWSGREVGLGSNASGLPKQFLHS